MSEFTGRKVSVGLAPEATRGTAQTAAQYWLNHMSLDFAPAAEKGLNESALGNLHKNNDSTTFSQWAEGSFEMKAGDQSLGALLYAATGTAAVATNADASGNVKDHTFTFDQSNSPKSFTFFRKDPNIGQAFPLAMISSLELSAELNGWVMCSGDVTALPGVTSAATVARIAENEFKPKHISVKMASAVAGLGAAPTVGTIQSLRLTVDRAISRDLQMGTDVPYDISVGEIEISGELVLRWSDQTYRDAWLNDTQQAMRITLQNTDVTIGTAANPKLVITLPRVSFSDWSPDQGLSDKVNQTISFTALYDVSSASAADFVLSNLVTQYTT